MNEVELIETLYNYAPWQKEWQFLKICDVPIGCAVPKDHILASRNLIQYEDLKTTPIMVKSPSISSIHKSLYDDIKAHGATTIEVEQYDYSVLWDCACNQYMMQVPYCWQDILADMVVIPCEWSYTLPYGFFYHKNAAKTVQEFIDFSYQLYHGENNEQLIPVFSMP